MGLDNSLESPIKFAQNIFYVSLYFTQGFGKYQRSQRCVWNFSPPPLRDASKISCPTPHDLKFENTPKPITTGNRKHRISVIKNSSNMKFPPPLRCAQKSPSLQKESKIFCSPPPYRLKFFSPSPELPAPNPVNNECSLYAFLYKIGYF